MNIKQLAGILIAGCLLLSCESKREVKDHTINVGEAMSAPTDLKASDYFAEIRYIPLETTDDCLIDANPQIMVLNDYLVITSGNDCFLFDKQAGRFIRKIGHYGDDPEGYKGTSFIPDEKNNRLLFPGWRNDLLAYSLEGEFIGSISVPVEGDLMASISNQAVLPDNNLVMCYSNMFGTEKDKLFLYTEQGELLNTVSNLAPSDSFQITHINMWSGNRGVEQFGRLAFGGLMILEDRQRQTMNILPLNNSFFWEREEGVSFKDLFNDTIYSVQDYKLNPRYVFDLGKYAWPYEKRNEANSAGRIFVSKILEGNDIIMFDYVLDCYSVDNNKAYNGIYRKSTGETTVSLYEKGFSDDLSNFMLLQPMTVSTKGEYASIIPADQITLWFEENPGKIQSLSEDAKRLEKVDEEDNPVVVIYR